MNKISETDFIQLEFKYKGVHPFKKLLFLFHGQYLKLIFSLILFAVKHSPVWILPVVMARMINIISDQKKYAIHDLWVTGIIYLVIILQNIPMHTFYVGVFSRALSTMQVNLRSSIVRRLQELSISFHDNYQTGKLQTKILRDVETLETLSRNLINTVYPALLTIIVAFTLTIQSQPLVALFYLIAVPLSSGLIFFFSKKMTARNKEYREEIEALSSRVIEMVQMIPITRAHGVEEVELSKMDTQLEKVKRKGIRLEVLGALFGSSSWTSFQIVMLLCLMFVSTLAFNKIISVGQVVLFQSFFAMIVGSINMILNSYPELSKGIESIRSISEILECPDIEQNEGKLPLDSVKGHFVFENVGYLYPGGKDPAVKNFNLEIASGETIAFVGESGSGKSTLMNLIIGFRRPTEGKIILDGIDMQDLDLRRYRRFIAVVPQKTILFSGSIRENITYGLEGITESRLWEILEIANAAEFVSKLPNGLDTKLGEYGSKLSGGQRQRIAIARALIRDPKIIVLDEATSALDVVTESLIQQAVQRLVKNRTTFVVAHRLSTIRIANRIVVMKNGRCVECGTHTELMESKGEYYKYNLIQR